MPRAPKKIKRPVGPPPKDIDWNRVDKLLISGAPSTKIADALGISTDTLYNRCQTDKGINYSAYSQQKKQCGDVILQEAQFDKAIGNTDKGDTTLLIWLGKTRLDQRESVAVTVSPQHEESFKSLMKEVADMQGFRQNVSSDKAQTEDENGLEEKGY